MRFKENLDGDPWKVKLRKKWDYYCEETKEQVTKFAVNNPDLIETVSKYAFTSLLVSIPLTVIAALFGKPLYLFFPFFIIVAFLLPVLEHYYIWCKEGWRDDYNKQK